MVEFLSDGKQNTGYAPCLKMIPVLTIFPVPTVRPVPCKKRRKFGKHLVCLRQNANLTQERLAELVELSPRHLQAIEAGDYWPTLPTLRKLHRALQVSWEKLCDE